MFSGRVYGDAKTSWSRGQRGSGVSSAIRGVGESWLVFDMPLVTVMMGGVGCNKKTCARAVGLRNVVTINLTAYFCP